MAIQICGLKKISQPIEPVLGQGTSAPQQKTKPPHVIGHVELGNVEYLVYKDSFGRHHIVSRQRNWTIPNHVIVREFENIEQAKNYVRSKSNVAKPDKSNS